MIHDDANTAIQDTPKHREVITYLTSLQKIMPFHIDIIPDDVVVKKYLYCKLLLCEDQKDILTGFVAAVMMANENILEASFDAWRHKYNLL